MNLTKNGYCGLASGTFPNTVIIRGKIVSLDELRLSRIYDDDWRKCKAWGKKKPVDKK